MRGLNFDARRVGAKRGKRHEIKRGDREAIAVAKEERGIDALANLLAADRSLINRVINGEVKTSPQLPTWRRLLGIVDGEPPYTDDEREALRLFRRAMQAAPHRRVETLREIEDLARRYEHARDVEEGRVPLADMPRSPAK